MNKLLEKLKKQQIVENKVEEKQPQQTEHKYDFVETYTLVNPKNAFMQYELFSLCQNIPVAIEGKGANTGFCDTIQLPTEHFLEYLKELKSAPNEISQNPLMRKVFIINLKNNEKMFVFPNIKHPKNPYIAFEEKTLPFNVTPQINHAIVDALKNFTR